MSVDWDEPLKGARPRHTVGEDLSRLSASELHERVALLETEIDRLREEISRKETSLSAAENIFTGSGGN